MSILSSFQVTQQAQYDDLYGKKSVTGLKNRKEELEDKAVKLKPIQISRN